MSLDRGTSSRAAADTSVHIVGFKNYIKIMRFSQTLNDLLSRFMATNDLMTELQKDSIKLDDDSERKVTSHWFTVSGVTTRTHP